MHITPSTVRQIFSILPPTHEIGGHISFNKAGDSKSIRWFEGAACRNANGARINGGDGCRIRKPDHAVSFHTHPKSNRPSSADLRNSICKHPRLRKVFAQPREQHLRRPADSQMHGRRQVSLVFTPKGVWSYRPTSALVSQWEDLAHSKSWQKQQMRKWSTKARKIYSNPATANGPTEYAQYLMSVGFKARYVPYTDANQSGVVLAFLDCYDKKHRSKRYCKDSRTKKNTKRIRSHSLT